jgi:hypothetical protein
LSAKGNVYRPVLREIEPPPSKTPPSRPGRHHTVVLRKLATVDAEDWQWVYGKDLVAALVEAGVALNHAYTKLGQLVAYRWAEKRAVHGSGWTVYRMTDAGRAVVDKHRADKDAERR